ncbi:tetratricopeptide repeat protein [Streptomyces sp. ST2-7A]|uniref:tetratricopeptide repeat protein n=1 Tax=Streptomyces sp. ST2-7A TaxID=2907214 RepID=UPI001F4383B8|nr:tetratricopeptide repeat protein [Streptomyces sp. ST2-7A]MCE7082990.1 tetratricopeptide repeat protein [Streptomyces sp. ST2-7A]
MTVTPGPPGTPHRPVPRTLEELPAPRREDVERLLTRVIEDEVRLAGDGTDAGRLLRLARSSVDRILTPAAEEWREYLRVEEEDAAGRFRERLDGRTLAAVTASTLCATVVALLLLSSTGSGSGSGSGSAGVALTGAFIVALASVVGFLLQAAVAHLWASESRAGVRNQPGGVEQLRLAWLNAVEVRGLNPWLAQQRAVVARGGTRRTPVGRASHRPPARDRSGVSRTRGVLERSFERLPEPVEHFPGRREELTRITRLVNRDRAGTDTHPTIVVLHGPPGTGRTALAHHVVHELRSLFRGACSVDLRGGSEDPMSTRAAALYLMNRLGAPRDQVLQREGGGRDGDEEPPGRLLDRYRQHLAGLPVVIVLDDAADPERVRPLIPHRSPALVLVTTSRPMDPADLLPPGDGPGGAAGPDPADRIHHIAPAPLTGAAAAELMRAALGGRRPAGPPDDPGAAGDLERLAAACAGRPLLLRLVGAALEHRPAADLARALTTGDGRGTDSGADTGSGPAGPAAPEGDPTERVLTLCAEHLEEPARRLLRRLAVAGRAAVGPAAAVALLDTQRAEAVRRTEELARAGFLQPARGDRHRLHESVRRFARARLNEEETAEERAAARERLIRSYAELADTVIRLVDGNTTTRTDALPGAAGRHGFTSLAAALRWLDEEADFITATLRHADPSVDREAMLRLLGALGDWCLLRGDLHRLGELNAMVRALDEERFTRSVRWRTGVAERQLGELDKARSTLTSVVDLYREDRNRAGAARALRDLGITLQHQGRLPEAAERLGEALETQTADGFAADRAWTLHALAAVERERGRVLASGRLLEEALELHRSGGSVHGEAWTRFQLGQTLLRRGRTADAERELAGAGDLYERSRDPRGGAWVLTELGRARLFDGDGIGAVERLETALGRHRETEDVRGEAWTLHHLGLALEEIGNPAEGVRSLERARGMFNRMPDIHGLALARHHSGRVTRDMRAEATGSLRNSGFPRQLLVDARRDFRRAGAPYGDAWSALELAVVDAGNERAGQALELADEALAVFAEGYGEGVPDARGTDWARFLRCTLLPLASPGGPEVGAVVAQEELERLRREDHPLRDPALADAVESFAVMLGRDRGPEEGWTAWRLGMVPRRAAGEVIGVTG